MKRVDDFRLKLGAKELVPIVTGGMGVDISTAALALVAARLGGIYIAGVAGVAALIRAHPGTISLGQGVVHYPPPQAALEAAALRSRLCSIP